MKQVCVAWLLLLCVTGAAGVLDAACTETANCSDTNQVCDNLKCKIKAEGACTDGTDNQHCVTDSACSGTTNSTAGTCNCTGTYVVDAGFCKVDVAGSCAVGESTKCKTGTVCDSSDSNVCKVAFDEDCSGDKSTLCTSATVCTSNKCKKMVNESCTASDDCAGSNVECSTSKLCTCTAGKSANADKSDCSGVSGLAGSVFLLIAALVTSRFLCTTTFSTVRELMGTA